MRWTSPGDGDYDARRAVFNAMIDRRPALIAECGSVEDVQFALRRARDDDLPIAVRGGGHSVAGYSSNNGGLVIDTRLMKGVHVDPVRRTARVRAGVTWAEMDLATHAHGLAVTGGRVSDAGVVGFTLGGGSGWLDRKLGLACDSLTAVEMVTVDGHCIRADAQHHPDLLWASRGAGGNFGVVTSIEFTLHPIGPTVLGGVLRWNIDAALDVTRTFRDWAYAAPDDLGSGLIIHNAHPNPRFQEALPGQPVVSVVVLWTGKESEGNDVIAVLRDLRPDVDLVRPTSYADFNAMFDHPRGMRHYWTSEHHHSFNDDALDVFLSYGKGRPVPTIQQSLIPWGGAVAAASPGASPLAQRSAHWVTHPLASWADPRHDEACFAWVNAFRCDMAPFASGGAFLNFLGNEGQDRVANAFGLRNYERLRDIKASYDPLNLLRANQNITPAA